MKPIELSDTERTALYKLWMVYGNNGPKHTHFNHRFIQDLIEKGIDNREFYTKIDLYEFTKGGKDESVVRLTGECVEEVYKILSNGDNRKALPLWVYNHDRTKLIKPDLTGW